MGKRPEDLNVDDTPLATTTTDARDEAYHHVLQEIQELLALGTYTWAQETLESIYDTISRTGRATEGQVKAIQNIAAGGRKSRGRTAPNYFRRYQR